MSRRRVAYVTAVTLLLVGVVASPLPAVAGERPRVLVDVVAAGGGFTPNPHGPLLDMRRLAPGRSTEAVLGVRNASGERAALRLAVDDVVDDDNGCNRPEERVDRGCGPGQGELSDQLVMDVAAATSKDGRFVPTWQGSLHEMVAGVDMGSLPVAGTRWLRITATLPRGSGNETQTDVVGFDLGVTLSLAGDAETVEVQGTTVGPRASGPGSVLGRLAELPATGAFLLFPLLVGLCLVAGGLTVRRGASALGAGAVRNNGKGRTRG